MHVGAALIADEQALEPVQPGEGALDHPAPAAKAGAVLGAAAGDHRGDSASAQLTAVAVVVVAAVADDLLGPSPGSPNEPAHRRHSLEEREQLGDVVAVAARQGAGERDPGRIDEEVML